jgi:aspartyl aminopeptidase
VIGQVDDSRCPAGGGDGGAGHGTAAGAWQDGAMTASVELIRDDIEASPTPYHAARRAAEVLEAAGWQPVDPALPLPRDPGGRYLFVRGGSVLAWALPEGPADCFVVAGAHTDSPNLRVKAHPDRSAAGFRQLGVEVYGGVLVNSWLDRDLGLAGRVATIDPAGVVTTRLFADDRPLLRIPQLAIHLDRDVWEKGLLLDLQRHLSPLWGVGHDDPGGFRRYLAERLCVTPDQVLSWDVMAFDVQPPAIAGAGGELLSSARIDNLVSCFAAVRALASVGEELAVGTIPVVALFDHEEVGSATATGAAGALLATTLERISASAGLDRDGHLRTLLRSLVVSADGAHATNPNYVERHEPEHLIELNAGIVVKHNANQRYATDAHSEARLLAVCRQAEVPVQHYVHRNDLVCGSTIGPITAARLGVEVVDVGVPQLAMHSVRELAGVDDVAHLQHALRAAWCFASPQAAQ